MRITNDEILELISTVLEIPVEKLTTVFDHSENVFYIEVEND